MKKNIKNEQDNILAPFSKTHNDSDGLPQKAIVFAPFLFGTATMATKWLLESIREINFKNSKIKITNKAQWQCLLEYLVLFLHLVDRKIWDTFSEEEVGVKLKSIEKLDKREIKEAMDTVKRKRNLFMDTLNINIEKGIIRLYKKAIDVEQFKNYFIQLYDERQKEYAIYEKFYPKKNEGAKNTLFWEFGKKIAKVFNLEMDIRIIVAVQVTIPSVLDKLNLKVLLSSIKKH